MALISTASKVQISSQANTFRPIYYLGCKASFTSVIKAAIEEVDPSGGRLLDLFSGTGSVGAALSTAREVTTVDVQEYSRVLCSAILNPFVLSQTEIIKVASSVSSDDTVSHMLWCLQPLINHEHACIKAAVNGDCSALVELLESPPLAVQAKLHFKIPSTPLGEATCEVLRRFDDGGLLHSASTTMSRYFGGLYFSFTQAATLDAILSITDFSDERKRNTLKAAALSTASQLVNTVGKQFAQPIQPRNKSGIVKPGLFKIVQRDRSMDTLELYQIWLGKYSSLPRAIGKPQSFCQDHLTFLTQSQSSFSVAYADPPYTRDHYSRFYHVLETMCLRDNPTISRVKKNGFLIPSRGAYREDRYQSEFCIRSAAPSAFDKLFKATSERNLPLVLSYSPHETGDGTHPRVVGLEQIIELARNYYKQVDVCIVDGITHNQLNRSGLKLKSRDHAEILLKCFL